MGARRIQALEKESRLQEMAKQERDEFQKIVENQKVQRENEVNIEKEKLELRKKNAFELRKQMAQNEEHLRQLHRDEYEEGKKVKDKMENERRTLERIKQDKLNLLYSDSIAEKYTAELARYKIVNF